MCMMLSWITYVFAFVYDLHDKACMQISLLFFKSYQVVVIDWIYP